VQPRGLGQRLDGFCVSLLPHQEQAKGVIHLGVLWRQRQRLA
jgi:hypothetical protein